MTRFHADLLRYADDNALAMLYRWISKRLDDAMDNHMHAQRTGDWSMREYYSGKVDELRCQLADIEYETAQKEARRVHADG